MRFRAEPATAPSRAPWIATNIRPAPATFLRRPAIRASRRPIGTPRVRDRQSRRLLSVRFRATVASGRTISSHPRIAAKVWDHPAFDAHRMCEATTTGGGSISRPPGRRRGHVRFRAERLTTRRSARRIPDGERTIARVVVRPRNRFRILAATPPSAGYRRSPEGAASSDGGGAVDRYRAVPRQDAPRPSYDAPRPSPRSYGAPSQESRPPSYRRRAGEAWSAVRWPFRRSAITRRVSVGRELRRIPFPRQPAVSGPGDQKRARVRPEGVRA